MKDLQRISRGIMQTHFLSLGLRLIFLFALCLFASCERQFNDACGSGIYLDHKSNTADFFVRSSASLQSAEDLVDPQYVSGKFFCLTTTTVIYDQAHGPLRQPCFTFAANQIFTGESTNSGDLLEVIDPQKFLAYYHSIPKELNKFLVIKVEGYNSILKRSNIYKPVPASYNAWSGEFGGGTYLSNMLHGDILTEEDAHIAIYLPLNQGIKTREYAGVVPDQSPFANPRYKLTQTLQQKIVLMGGQNIPGCGFDYLYLHSQVDAENFKAILQDYQDKVKIYHQAHPTAFPDPYATP